MKNFKQKPPEPPKAKPGIVGGSVNKYMATNLITFTPDTHIMIAIETLLEKRISGAPVLNEKNEVIGMVDDKDCLRVLIDSVYHNLPMSDRTVSAYMDKVMKTIPSNSDISEVANEFLNSKYKRLLVIDDTGKLVGQISRRDVLRAIKDLNL